LTATFSGAFEANGLSIDVSFSCSAMNAKRPLPSGGHR
jgi:hypothetical protein